MANMLVRLGVYVVTLAVTYLVVAEIWFEAKPYARVQQIAVAGVALMGIGFLLRIASRAADKMSVMRAGKCIVCKMRIPRGHEYCFRHARDLDAR